MNSEKKRMTSKDRRSFLKTAFFHVAAVGTAGNALGNSPVLETEAAPKNPFSSDPLAIRKLTDRVSTTRLGFGTGMAGGSELRALTEKEGIELLLYSYDRGFRFFDTADSYRTHRLVGKALKDKDRSQYTLTSKMWLHREVEKPLDEQPSAREILTRFLREIDTDYIDILQIHCMMKPGWASQFARYMDELDEENLEILKTAQENGKGTIIMKVAGEGSFDSETVGESIKYIAKLETADTMVVGMNSKEQVDFLIDKTAESLQEELV